MDAIINSLPNSNIKVLYYGTLLDVNPDVNTTKDLVILNTRDKTIISKNCVIDIDDGVKDVCFPPEYLLKSELLKLNETNKDFFNQDFKHDLYDFGFYVACIDSLYNSNLIYNLKIV